MDTPIETDYKRNNDGTFAQGTKPGPGRPSGQSLKEYWRMRFYAMSDEEKAEFSRNLGLDTIWKMAEGNPRQDTDITTDGRPIVMVAPEVALKNAINPSAEPNS